jgi:pimeloyl-ACP methyl ester carboxylesterase
MSGVVLEDPPWRDEDGPPDPERFRKFQEETVKRKKLRVEEIAAAGKEDSPAWDDIEFGPWAEAKKQLSMNVFNWAVDDHLRDWRSVAKRISCPCLLVTADVEKGAIVWPEVATAASTLCPSMVVVRLEKAGHNIRRESFEEYVDAVGSFLRRKD